MPSRAIWPCPPSRYGLATATTWSRSAAAARTVVDLAPHGGRGHVLGSPDDVDGVARAGGEALVEQVGGSLGLRSGGPVVGGVAAAEAAAGDRRGDEDDEPAGDDETAVPVAEVGQSFQHQVLLGAVRLGKRDARRHVGRA